MLLQMAGESSKRLLLRDYLYITLGSFLIAIAVTWIFAPNKIVTGGVSGIAILLYHTFHIPISLSSLCINVPLFWLGYKFLGGREYAMKTLYGIVAVTLFLRLTEPLTLNPLTEDTLLASIYGGLFVGTGLGVVFRGRASTGGTDLAAQLFQNWTGLTAGKTLLFIDGLVIAIGGAIFGVERVLYALISLFITSKMIDLVQQGLSMNKVAYIITDHENDVRDTIVHNLSLGCTVIPSFGAYTSRSRQMLMTVVRQSEVTRLKELVRDMDPKAFVIVTDVHEVLGEGFSFARGQQDGQQEPHAPKPSAQD